MRCLLRWVDDSLQVPRPPPPHHPTSLIPNQSIFEMTVLDKMQKVAELSPSVDDFCKNVVFSELSSRFGPI